jgi:hypothetical protein
MELPVLRRLRETTFMSTAANRIEKALPTPIAAPGGCLWSVGFRSPAPLFSMLRPLVPQPCHGAQAIARALSPAVGLGGMAVVVLLRLRILRRLRAGALSRRGGKGAALPRRRRTGRKLSGTYCRVNKMR